MKKIDVYISSMKWFNSLPDEKKAEILEKFRLSRGSSYTPSFRDIPQMLSYVTQCYEEMISSDGKANEDDGIDEGNSCEEVTESL